MPQRSRRLVALLASFSLLTPPALGVPTVPASAVVEAGRVITAARATPDHRGRLASRLVALGDDPVTAGAAAQRLTDADLAVLGAHPRMMQRAGDGGRARVRAMLMELGRPPAEAARLADQLTAADLVVLLRHPEMMQRAGELSETSKAVIIGILIFGGLIALIAASNSSSSLMIR